MSISVCVKPYGFTLSELLIVLLVLGVIATFTIPKVLTSQQNQKNNATFKEGMGTFSGAFQSYQLLIPVTSATSTNSLASYINYIKIITSGTIDGSPANGAGWTLACSAGNPCYQLASGAILGFYNTNFVDTTQKSAIVYLFDPDGKSTGKADSVWVYLYPNGLITTENNCLTGTLMSDGFTCNPNNSPDPTWLKW